MKRMKYNLKLLIITTILSLNVFAEDVVDKTAYQVGNNTINEKPTSSVGTTLEVGLVEEGLSTTETIVSGEKEAIENIQASFIYEEDSLYTIYARINYITSIVLQPGEEVVYVAGGDTARWSLDQSITGSEKGKRTTVFIKPYTVGIKTNLIISTNKRTYQLKVFSAREWYNPVVKFLYPNEEKLRYTAKVNSLETMNVGNLSDLDYNYKFTDNKWFHKVKFLPDKVFNDGEKTYIIMKNQLQEMPALYVFENGELQLVNFRIKGQYIIVDRLFESGKLVLGKEEVTINRYYVAVKE